MRTALLRLKELETVEKVTEKIDQLSVFSGLEESSRTWRAAKCRVLIWNHIIQRACLSPPGFSFRARAGCTYLGMKAPPRRHRRAAVRLSTPSGQQNEGRDPNGASSRPLDHMLMQ
jgi:hypothetical protein